MDVHDIFNKLSKGVRFNKKKVEDQGVNPATNCKDFTLIDNESLKKKYDKDKLASIKKEQVAHLRNINKITVSGRNAPDPIQNFSDLSEIYNVDKQIIKNIKTCGYKKPTPVQMQIIPSLLNDRQVLACAPTGSGKTASFLIPLLAKLRKSSKEGFRAIILCPTRELSTQILRECTLLSTGTGLKAHCIKKVSQDSKKFGPNFSKKFDILISTPNRLIYLLKKENSVVSFNKVEWLIIDESDKLFETGVRSFREQLAEIYRSCNENVNKAMFSATYSAQVAKWSSKNIKNILLVTIGQRNTTVEDIDQKLVYVGDEIGKLIAFRELIKEGLMLPALIFVKSKERAKQLFSELIFDGINVDVMHSDRTQLQRDNLVKSFREGKVWALICTELVARGIDFKGVKLVVNYDFPISATSYIHRVGRTGRAGRVGKAISFFTDEDKPYVARVSRLIKGNGAAVPEYLLALKNKSNRKNTKTSTAVGQEN